MDVYCRKVHLIGNSASRGEADVPGRKNSPNFELHGSVAEFIHIHGCDIAQWGAIPGVNTGKGHQRGCNPSAG